MHPPLAHAPPLVPTHPPRPPTRALTLPLVPTLPLALSPSCTLPTPVGRSGGAWWGVAVVQWGDLGVSVVGRWLWWHRGTHRRGVKGGAGVLVPVVGC
jgi:hypothetical protein